MWFIVLISTLKLQIKNLRVFDTWPWKQFILRSFWSQFNIFQKKLLIPRRKENEHGRLGAIIFMKN